MTLAFNIPKKKMPFKQFWEICISLLVSFAVAIASPFFCFTDKDLHFPILLLQL